VWLDRLAKRKGAWHWAVKSPSNICRLGYILKTMPHSRIVMIVRDGRDSLLSLRERFPKEDVLGDYVLGRWVNDNLAGLLYQADPRIMIIRLEDLSHHPHEWLPIILHHVGAPASWNELDQLLAPSARRSHRRLSAAHSFPGHIPATTPTLPERPFFGNIYPSNPITSLEFYNTPRGGPRPHATRRYNRSQTLVEMMLTPGSELSAPHRRRGNRRRVLLEVSARVTISVSSSP
jgi:hypothetical protein